MLNINLKFFCVLKLIGFIFFLLGNGIFNIFILLLWIYLFIFFCIILLIFFIRIDLLNCFLIKFIGIIFGWNFGILVF